MAPSKGLVCLALFALTGACRSERGASYDCSCAMLTDFDDGSRRLVEVCAPSAERAPDVARGCAQSAAPATIQGCDCKPLGVECSLGDCRPR